MSDAERAEMEKEIACCENAAVYCHTRAAMAWTEKSRAAWSNMAAKNEADANERWAKLGMK